MLSFQDIILNLKSFWSQNKCIILESYDFEVGAGTLAPYTALNILNKPKWNICQVQYCRRPTDGRNAENPNRLSRYYQMQVVLKPVPDNIQYLCINSLESIGLETKKHDIRFIEDDWENPSIGASGLGYEVWCDGMEIIQFTYMQKIGGIECKIISGEITYGLERVAMYIQNKDKIFDIMWDNFGNKYSDVHSTQSEKDICFYYQNCNYDNEILKKEFDRYESLSQYLLSQNNITVAYDSCLKASHILNILDARGLLSQSERLSMILRIRTLVKMCLEKLPL